MSDSPKKPDLAATRDSLRARLEGARGRDYWRSLDDLASAPGFKELIENAQAALPKSAQAD